jgi:hypothetical protein
LRYNLEVPLIIPNQPKNNNRVFCRACFILFLFFASGYPEKVRGFMQHRNLHGRLLVVFVLVGILAMSVAAAVLAKPPANTAGSELLWSSIDEGGMINATSGNLQMGGTFGQFDTSMFSSGMVKLQEGFWSGINNSSHVVYLPAVRR